MNHRDSESINEPQRHRDTEGALNDISWAIIGAAIEVHRCLGPGLVERIYDAALCIEFELRDIGYVRQHGVPARYKGRTLGHYYIDFLVARTITRRVL